MCMCVYIYDSLFSVALYTSYMSDGFRLDLPIINDVSILGKVLVLFQIVCIALFLKSKSLCVGRGWGWGIT